jgi:hypothetical protein
LLRKFISPIMMWLTCLQGNTSTPATTASSACAADANGLCDDLASQLQQLVANYQETRQQLGAVGEQLSQAWQQLSTAKEQLQGPPPHEHYSRLAQSCVDLDAAVLRLAQLQHSSDMTPTHSSSSSSGGSGSSASRVGQALQGIQRHLLGSAGADNTADIIEQVRFRYHCRAHVVSAVTQRD